MPNPKPLRSITIIRDADNRSLELWGMPYRYDAAGYAVCAKCHTLYFRADRPGAPDCPHYHPDDETTLPPNPTE